MRKISWISAATLCAAVMLSVQARAATYYVAGEDPKAADTKGL